MNAIADIIDGFRARSGELTFLDRLDDVRSRLINSLVVVILTTGIGFYFAAWPVRFELWGRTVSLDALALVVAPIEPYLNGERLKYLSPTDPFIVTLKLALTIGLLLAMPYLLSQIWGLVSPLMRAEEKRYVGPAVVGGVFLFAIGAVFCYMMALPLMLQFTMGFQQESLQQSIVIGEYLTIVLRMILAFGLAFELPIAVLLGTLLGFVTPDLLSTYRRHAIAVMVVVSAIVTPPDLSSLILLMIPLLLLYEVSIFLSRMVVARRARAAGAQGGLA